MYLLTCIIRSTDDKKKQPTFSGCLIWARFQTLHIPGGSDSKELGCNAGDQVQSLGQEDSLEMGMATNSSILASEFQGQRSLVGYSPWGHKESDTTERLTLT